MGTFPATWRGEIGRERQLNDRCGGGGCCSSLKVITVHSNVIHHTFTQSPRLWERTFFRPATLLQGADHNKLGSPGLALLGPVAGVSWQSQ